MGDDLAGGRVLDSKLARSRDGHLGGGDIDLLLLLDTCHASHLRSRCFDGVSSLPASLSARETAWTCCSSHSLRERRASSPSPLLPHRCAAGTCRRRGRPRGRRRVGRGVGGAHDHVDLRRRGGGNGAAVRAPTDAPACAARPSSAKGHRRRRHRRPPLRPPSREARAVPRGRDRVARPPNPAPRPARCPRPPSLRTPPRPCPAVVRPPSPHRIRGPARVPPRRRPTAARAASRSRIPPRRTPPSAPERPQSGRGQNPKTEHRRT